MIDHSRPPQDQLPPPPAFTPVPRARPRHDGWTTKRQQGFIEALCATGSVKSAAHAVNMTPEGAYYLRRQPGAESFAAAWAAALDHGIARLEDIAMERALNGVESPVYCHGNIIGTRTTYNDRLLMFLLRNRSPSRFSADNAHSHSAATAAQLARLKAQWRAEWEAEAEAKAAAEAEASIASLNAKLELIAQRYSAAQDDDEEQPETPAPQPESPPEPQPAPASPTPAIRILDNLLTHGDTQLGFPHIHPRHRPATIIGKAHFPPPRHHIPTPEECNTYSWQYHLDHGTLGGPADDNAKPESEDSS